MAIVGVELEMLVSEPDALKKIIKLLNFLFIKKTGRT